MSGLSQPIFVVGCPRSGTTLVQCILSASSHAFSLPETHFFSSVIPALDPPPNASLQPAELEVMRRTFDADAELVLPDSFWTALCARPKLTERDVFVAVVEHFRPAPDLRVIEKTPRHVLHLEAIDAAFPDAVFVNVVRDPIDVASSLQGVPFETSRSMLNCAQRWTESICAARSFAHAHPDRLRSVVYERLVREPESTVRELCAFVGLAYEPTMLEEFGGQAARNVGRGEAWKSDVQSGVILDRQGVWRSRITPGQAWLVARATRRPRREYGYTQWPAATAGSVLSATAREARIRFEETRPSAGLVGAARHAGSVLKTLSAA